MIYNIYSGYYEIYVTDKKLKKPLILTYQAANINELNAYLMDVDDHILVDIDIYDGCDCNAVFKTVYNKPEIIEDFFED